MRLEAVDSAGARTEVIGEYGKIVKDVDLTSWMAQCQVPGQG